MLRSIIFSAFAALTIPLTTTAQVQAYFTPDQFWSPETGNYVDLNLNLVGQSLEYADESAKVEVLSIVEQEGAIVDFKKTIVSSPMSATDTRPDLIHQERFALDPGTYQLSIEIKDLNVPDSPVGSLKKQFVVADKGESVWFSDVQLAESIAPSVDDGATRFGFRVVMLTPVPFNSWFVASLRL